MKRSEWLTVNLGVSEKAAVRSAATRARRTMSEWARLILLDALKGETK